MDLAASATFVAEPPEDDLMRRPPRDPQELFMSRAMATSILSAGLGLCAAVSVAYLVTWYAGAEPARAQTIAFITWLVGHVLLALNVRSQRRPLFRLGLLSNRLMLVWAAATAGFVLLVGLAPGAHSLFKTVPLTGAEWALALGAAALGTSWMEICKLLHAPVNRKS